MSALSQLKNKLLAKLLTRFPSLADKAAQKIKPLTFDNTPWVPFDKPLNESKISLVTTAGVHLVIDKPFDMEDSTGDPTYRVVPTDRSPDGMMITHDYYDHKDADRDINIVFPIDRLKELADEGIIGSVSSRFFGFMGHIEENHIERFVKDQIPQVAKMMKEDGVDAVLVTPG